MGGFIIGAGLVLLGAYIVAAGRRRGSAWVRRLGWVLIVMAVLYLLVGALAEFGPDLSQD